MENLSPNTVISLDMWNDVVSGVRFPQYQYSWRTSFVVGGVLDAYRIAGNSFILDSIEDNITRYNEYRDTRSNYMQRSYTNPSGWVTANAFTSRLNSYTYTGRRNARLLMNSSTGIISTLNTSIYLIYAEIIVSNVTSHSYVEMKLLKNGSLVSSNYELTPTAVHSAWSQVSTHSIYENANYSLQFRFGGNGVGTVRMGYAEFIGNKNNCGALS